jgi:hypothetical protein
MFYLLILLIYFINKMVQCQCTTQAGARCKKTAIEDSKFCSIHQNCSNIYKTSPKKEKPSSPKKKKEASPKKSSTKEKSSSKKSVVARGEEEVMICLEDNLCIIYPYQDKDYLAIVGSGTYEIKDELIENGGKYNRYLKHPEIEDETLPGYIFFNPSKIVPYLEENYDYVHKKKSSKKSPKKKAASPKTPKTPEKSTKKSPSKRAVERGEEEIMQCPYDDLCIVYPYKSNDAHLAIIGLGTISKKKELIARGGKFNRYLQNPETKKSLPGYIFFDIDEIADYLEDNFGFQR